MFVATFDSLLNNRALCFSTSVNSVCSSDSEKFGLLFSLILVQKYRMYYTEQLRTKFINKNLHVFIL
jgi:hypothetical protein